MKKIFLTNKQLLADVQSWLRNTLLKEVSEDVLLKITIVLNEVIQNIYRYTYNHVDDKEIIIDIKKSEDNIEFIIEDRGSPSIDQSFLNRNNEPSENGGFGLKIIKENSETFKIQPQDTGNKTHLSIKI